MSSAKFSSLEDEGSSQVRARVAKRTKTTRGAEVRITEGGVLGLENDLLEVRPGYAVLMFRSPRHHVVKEVAGKDDGGPIDFLKLSLTPDSLLQKRLQKQLEKEGFPPHDFAYVHLCILVGQNSNGDWYVVENAGGSTLALRCIERAFNDQKGDESSSMVMRTKDPERTCQRALAAFFHRFAFVYNMKGGFSCETFVSACSGQFDDAYSKENCMSRESKKLEKAARRYLHPMEDLETASKNQKDFLKAAESYAESLAKCLGVQQPLEPHNEELLCAYVAYKREKNFVDHDQNAVISNFLGAAAKYCKQRLPLQTVVTEKGMVDDAEVLYQMKTDFPSRHWPCLLAAATQRPGGPNPVTRAQTKEKFQRGKADLGRERWRNLEAQVTTLMDLFYDAKVTENIKRRRYELVKGEEGKIGVAQNA